MKKDLALEWFDRVITAATALAGARGLGELQPHRRLVHDEWDQQARWAGRWAFEGWPSVPEPTGGIPRPGLRYEVWLRPGKAADQPITLILACADDPGLTTLHPHLAPVWETLLSGGKAAGRYQPLDRLEPLAARLEAGVMGVARHVAPDWRKVEPALEWLILDSHKLVEAALETWRAAGGPSDFEQSRQDPLEALRQRFSGGHRA